ncbi:MAG: RecQ family ATP-dependent DNA helicase [Bacteroidia bacterium]|jgi:ATP-dependent DNA helicase RecQ|nr:RecQ family ATP-dependent DNA helicase [Bacteroidia bacterium]MCC6769276.1 RecQ family ATP-dependent DNA helicase [Bacteroidia bacterium]
MLNPQEVLLKFWGFDKFRPLQTDIIQSVLDGHDTLALLPTGGGKSICFQVPALCIEQTCLVVSPLIALMKDQVTNLQQKRISAIAITSDLNQVEMDRAFNQCLNGKVQFLYVSPERLRGENFRDILTEIKPGLIAVDEAHCISQWGYDFRPAYLQIAEIRECLPNTPVIALTATATPQVCDDIEAKLHFKNHQRFKKSFTRPNLTYVVRKTDNKPEQLLRILSKVPGPSVVYVNNRKKTQEIANLLLKEGVSATYYHAGIDPYTRNNRQSDWIQNSTRVIVSTNAFGMGIDKPDVRTVIHMGIPESPEAYFQEAGRAGRDGQKAWAVLLADTADLHEMTQRFEEQYPDFEMVKAVYNWLGNYFQLPVEAGEQQSFPFDLNDFSNRYQLRNIAALQALRFIEREGLISIVESQQVNSKILILVNHEVLYDFEFRNPSLEPVIKTLLRSYAGIFTDFVIINENELAKRLGVSYQKTIELLKYLDKCGILSYLPATGLPNIYYLMPRQHPERLPLSKKNYENRKDSALTRLNSMKAYLQNDTVCRSIQLVKYFGETKSLPCGTCDVCNEQRKNNQRDTLLDKRCMEILLLIEQGTQAPPEIIAAFADPDRTTQALRVLIDEGIVKEDTNGLLFDAS